MLQKAKQKASEAVLRRRADLERILGKPNLVDEISFMSGLFIVMILQACTLSMPEWMGLLYTALVWPLLVVRYLLYRRNKEVRDS